MMSFLSRSFRGIGSLHLVRAVRFNIVVALVGASLFFLPEQAQAMKIQEITSPGGIKAWLVHEKSVPIISMNFGFKGGASQDPADRVGLSYFVSGMLDEGAGDLTSVQFHERMEELAIKISFDTTRDVFSGNMRTLSENKADAFEMLRLALTEPRFDDDAVERIKSQILAGLKFDENDPSKVAAKAWFKTAFKDHPYGRPTKGTTTSVQAISGQDLKGYVSRVIAKDTLSIAVVGDIGAEELGALLDKTFGSLPEKADLSAVPEAEAPKGPVVEIVPMDVPQSVAEFGMAGLKRHDPDFIPAYVLNYIIGGGGFSSRLTEEVREKRGLAYSVYSYLYPFDHGAAYIGNVATQNKDMGQSLEVIQSVLDDIVANGPTADELKNAKQYLTGSYPLRFDTSSKISSQLLWIQIEGLGVSYIDERNAMIEAVSAEDLKRVAQRLIESNGLIVTIVGQPEGVSARDGKS